MKNSNPNAKTFEFYLDSLRRGMDEDSMVVNPDYQQLLFENTIQACRESETVEHVVLIESPLSSREHAEKCAQLLDTSNVPFTYIKLNGSLENYKDYTCGKGTKVIYRLRAFWFE